jgi:hypothetical protein
MCDCEAGINGARGGLRPLGLSKFLLIARSLGSDPQTGHASIRAHPNAHLNSHPKTRCNAQANRGHHVKPNAGDCPINLAAV